MKDIELPEPAGHVHSDGEFCWDKQPGLEIWPISLYTADQLRAEVEADRAQRVPEHMIVLWNKVFERKYSDAELVAFAAGVEVGLRRSDTDALMDRVFSSLEAKPSTPAQPAQQDACDCPNPMFCSRPCALTVTQPAQQELEPTKAVAYLDIGTGGYVDLGSELSPEELAALPRGRHMLVIAGTYGIDGYKPATHQDPPQPVERKPRSDDRAWDRWICLDCKSSIKDVHTASCPSRHHGIRE